MLVSPAEGARICYAANAVEGKGGQGEFLRQMVYALDRLPHARIFSRGAKASRAECVNLPFDSWQRFCFQTIGQVPVLRRRRDILTLLDDIQFDAQLSSHAGSVSLLDGVMGQCCRTFDMLSRRAVPLVLTALNTHIDNVADVLADEHRRMQVAQPSFIHPRMRERVSREIDRAWCIRAISKLVKQTFIERGLAPEKIEVVLPAVDLDYFHPTPKRDDVFRVLAVLTIDPRKGAYYLLQAFEKAAVPNSELVIIGSTGDRWSSLMLRQFTARLKNIQVRSANVLKDPIEKTYGPASVFVHPAIEDGFALAVAQALACGKPVITTHQTGAAELIAEGKNGYLLECRDVDGLVDRLRFLARDEALVRRLSVAAAESVSHLGYPSFAQNVARLYERVLAA
jgi:glycosyltransferase involved in cell wall biosynthesis